MEPKIMNIWEEALKDKAVQFSQSSAERTLIVIGNQSSGKSTFIKILRNQPETESKPTYLLQYSFIRKSMIKKQLIHCYEIASKNQIDMLPSLFSKDSFSAVTVAICLDLSKPTTLIQEATEWVSLLRQQIELSIHQKIGMEEKYSQWLLKRRSESNAHEDLKALNFPPINIVFVGCKYDIHEKYETENRKWISKALRYLAHFHNSSLACCSSKNSSVTPQLRTFLTEILFEQTANILCQKDYLKPLFVFRNQDSFSQIGVPTQGAFGGFQLLKKQLIGLFGEEQIRKKEGIDVTKYSEGKIDSLIEQRKKELVKIGRGKKSV